jgi:uncharacterized protein
MKLEQSFDVAAPLDDVWAALIDVERVAPCLPGAAITEVGEDGSYNGTFKVKLGPTTAEYRGSLQIESADEATRTATMRATGSDKRGQGGAKATIVNTLSEAGGVTRVDVVTDFTITGKLARFGRGGMVQDVSNRLMREFSSCLASRLAAEQEARAAAAAAVAQAGPAAATDWASPGGAGIEPPPAPGVPPLPASRPVSGFSLMLGALWDRIRRLFGRGPR